MNEICSIYQNAISAQEKGEHILSVDEMTGIVARERKYPNKPVLPGKEEKVEFEYIRHRTTSLIGFFDVATGRVEKPYLKQTRKEKDFVEAVKRLIETDGQASWTLICDGLNIHKSESLVRFVAEKCEIKEDLGQKKRKGILKNQASREEFLSKKEHQIRFVYTPKHCSWINQIEVWFSIMSRRLLKRKSYRSVKELEESILRFIKQYNVTAKRFQWSYQGEPLVV